MKLRKLLLSDVKKLHKLFLGEKDLRDTEINIEA
jgi:hypothetical protein